MLKTLVLSIAMLGLIGCAGKGTKDSSAAEPAKTAAGSKKTKMSKNSKEMKVAEGAVTCQAGKDKRLIEVMDNGSGGCEVFYTKFGNRKSMASAAKGNAHCNKVRDKVIVNLEKYGFKCN